jgi:hypothetical protein
MARWLPVELWMERFGSGRAPPFSWLKHFKAMMAQFLGLFLAHKQIFSPAQGKTARCAFGISKPTLFKFYAATLDAFSL